VDKLDPKKFIIIKGARTHNLKNIDVAIPRKQLVVVTGVSGSGKSSLTIDTLFAEGQRRYVESLSSYARQFLSRMAKPDLDYIKGICPAIAIEQKVATKSSRSTVGTLTEIYDYLRLLYGRIGKTYSPVSGKEVKKDSVSDVVDHLFSLDEGTKVLLLVPLNINEERTVAKELDLLLQKGFTRLWFKKEVVSIEDADVAKIEKKPKDAFLLIDRLVVKQGDESAQNRAADSVQTAFYESGGECMVQILDGKKKTFSNRFEADGIEFTEPTPNFFNFNNPYGACKRCEGFGTTIGVATELVIPDRSKSVYDDAIVPWKTEKMSALYKDKLITRAAQFDFPIHRPINELTKEQYDLLWTGNDYFYGLNEFFEEIESQKHKIQYRVMLSRYRGRTICPDCKGTRIRKDSQYVKINGVTLNELIIMPIKESVVFINKLKLNAAEKKIAKRILLEVNNRLHFMLDVGLSYLTLNRLSSSLSGGETQRINLTRTLGSNLTSSMYILDEPSIGLHPRDTGRLIKILRQLRDLGNTVIVVEHEEDIIRAADQLIDIGPEAGRLGGELLFNGPSKDIKKAKTLTADYLYGKKEIALPDNRRKVINSIEIIGANQHNLKNIDVKIPLNALTVVSGVSGSGKTTLIKSILYPALKRAVGETVIIPGEHKEIKGDFKSIKQVELIDQNPLGRSSRSNPVTYIKAYDGIRKLYANHKLSKARNYKPSHFSFNVEGGRCETCKGEGEVVIEMQFLADVRLVCETCDGQRFKNELLDIKINNKTINDVLEMTVAESLEFFEKNKDIYKPLKALSDVGLDYIRLGQSSSTLSGGEAQRVKLASFLSKGSGGKPIFFIFDEPTTGLHFHDINKLLTALNALVEKGHTVVVIEHNMEVIKSGDWLVDLGPEGGDEGGYLLYQGVPEGLPKVKKSYTGKYLKGKLKG